MDIKTFCFRYPHHAEEVEERAAIIQYDGGLSLTLAEELAVRRLLDKYGLENETRLLE